MVKRVFNEKGEPVYRDYIPGERLPEGWSIEPFFPGYSFENGVSTYKGFTVGEGGFVFAIPGYYEDVALLDIASMHPSSIIAENLFGDKYTKRFKDIVDARIAIKHNDLETARKLMDGRLAPYLENEEQADQLATVLKIPINATYGQTFATYPCRFKDPRNIDNIVAKRGALFMVNLKEQVEARGFVVAHIKTDSIKIPHATPEIIDFVMNYGKEYGYNFEHEATYSKLCLVNDAVYIAKYDEYGQRNKRGKHANEWTATGKQFQVPYVFKTLFSHEPIVFKDLCEVKSVTGTAALYLRDTDENGDDKLIFVGKVGSFCPIKKGCGGHDLVRKDGDKVGYAPGCKNTFWKEAETVKELGLEEQIDHGYYRNLVDAAVDTISKYCNFDELIA